MRSRTMIRCSASAGSTSRYKAVMIFFCCRDVFEALASEQDRACLAPTRAVGASRTKRAVQA